MDAWMGMWKARALAAAPPEMFDEVIPPDLFRPSSFPREAAAAGPKSEGAGPLAAPPAAAPIVEEKPRRAEAKRGRPGEATHALAPEEAPRARHCA